MKLKILIIIILCSGLTPPALADDKGKDATAPVAAEAKAAKPSAPAPIAIPADRFEAIRKLALARQGAQNAYNFILNSAHLDKSSGCAQTLLAGLRKESELADAKLELALAEAREEFKIPRGYVPNYDRRTFDPPQPRAAQAPGQ